MHERLLVVDDDYKLREGLAMLLRDQGYSVATAPDGEAAMGVIRDDNIDLVLTDVTMKDPATGEMSARAGLDLLANIQKEFPGIPVAMITAMQSIDTAVEALRAGAVNYITKPFHPGEIGRAVREALSSRQGGAPRPEDTAPISSRSPAMARVVDAAMRAARSDVTVLITGPQGSGKEFTARAIHSASRVHKEPFIAIAPQSIPENLFEAEMFGSVRGAFSGANRLKRGVFELAGRGTILIDAIDETNLSVQSKLMIPIEKKVIRRVGASHPITANARIMVTTSHPLHELVSQGRFREDLYYVLRVLTIDLPALRDRREDLPDLCRTLLASISRENSRNFTLQRDALEYLNEYSFPGNIRELQNILRSAATIATESRLNADVIRRAVLGATVEAEKLSTIEDAVKKAERARIVDALARNPRSLVAAAGELGISRTTLWRKIREFGLDHGTEEIVSM